MFKAGKIEGVIVRNLVKFIDERGWLTETFRYDELEEQYFPVMGYISMTNVDVARGPHEHVDQSDNFAFIGPSNFKLYLWDNRKNSPTYMVRQILFAGEDAPKSVLIPPGVVHAYKNVGGKQGMVVNSPNRLFAGKGKKDPVDEVRHESDPNSIFTLD
ncbi:MAG: dTDP-4-dehydrorhamnose 3,5-epimerase family protein [Bacteroidota bacterium]